MSTGKKFTLFPKKYGLFPFMWLIYIALPIFNIRNETGLKLILGYAMIALFVVTYRQLYMVSGKAFSLWLALQMAIIVVLCMFYNPFNLYMGFFTANFIGWYTDHRKFNIAMIAFALVELVPLSLAVASISLNDFVFTLPFFAIMLASPFGIRSMVRRQNLEKELDLANQQIKELVKREERMRIARDLHDTLGHTLSLITLKSQLVEKLVLKDPERAQTEAGEIQRTSRAALRQVRELVSDMRAVSVAEGLAEAGEILRAADISLDIEGDAALESVSDLTQNILSLCIKEAVTNIVKHSEASRCFITISTTDAVVKVSVEDNGNVLETGDTIAAAAKVDPGNGLKGMAERLSLIDGSLSLSSGEKNGLRLLVTVPLIVKEQKEGVSA
ncbi:sensor histidine kinase [Paenibacillus sp. Marseille-P2973]|uniref:sensor histidine kinase n=1 Tax=unclassified Paenibacillus TaxID=185978 RepID=UPI001B37C75C|nr:sensor histidine kinase [Paenibacillus sp. Marseille-P2973]MBQ4901492.1 sensor histidine kinase [Paenibacillus sp. Marseille-P2973]